MADGLRRIRARLPPKRPLPAGMEEAKKETKGRGEDLEVFANHHVDQRLNAEAQQSESVFEEKRQWKTGTFETTTEAAKRARLQGSCEHVHRGGDQDGDREP